ncbi:MAG: lysozyme [Alphaproteobacteria bacterium]|nr:lysozyme [Alphaproteobacteria bacterium]OJV45222.1 MAG: hypothetical protein BGO28_00255 [Alphaproteobacteria bacterium 43-37]
MLQISHKGLALIKHFEGFKNKPYTCPGGYVTIGYGHVVGKDQKFKTITEHEAEELLLIDAQKALQALSRLVRVPLTQPQVDAIISFIFNLGAGAFQRSTLRACINRGDQPQACLEFLKWIKAGGKILPGLVKRRQAEAALYQSGIS